MKKTLKIIGGIVIVLILLLFGVQWWLESKIRKTLENEIYQETQGRVQMEIGHTTVRLIGRTVRLKDITVATDTTLSADVYQPLKYVHAYIQEIVIKGVHFKKRSSLMKVRARKLGINIPELSAINEMIHPMKKQLKDSNSPRLQLKVDKIDIRLGDIAYEQLQEKDTISYLLKDFHCQVDDWKMDTAPNRPFAPSCSDMQMTLAMFRSVFAERSQLIEIDSLAILGKKGFLAVRNICLLPQYSKQEFALKAPGHMDWTKIEAEKLVCRGFDMSLMMTEQKLKIDSISLQKAFIHSFKNRKIEQAKRVKRLFYESVQAFPLPLAIRRIYLNDIDVEYEELSKNGLSPGKITFNQLNGVFENLTNMVDFKQPYYTLKAHGKLMDQGVIQATFWLPVDSMKNHFEVEGSLGKMSILALNPMIEPLIKIKITSGEIEDMNFKIVGNSEKSKVNMIFLYDNLKIRIMKEKDGKLKTSSFFTTLANGLIAKGNNPDHRGIRKAEGTVERDIYRSQFNYLWRSLLAGLKISIGLG